MMEVPEKKRPSKKRRLDKVIPTLKAENGSRNGGASAAAADGSEPPTVNATSEVIHVNKYEVPYTQHSTDLEAYVSSKHSPTEQNELLTKVAKSKSNSGLEIACLEAKRDLGKNSLDAQIHIQSNDICPYDEALAIRYRAREIGLESFLQESVAQHRIQLQKLCQAFCIPVPVVPLDPPDSQLLARLRKAIAADMGNRIKLHKYNSVEDAISLTRRAKNIMVITGAGMSTSLNIPDFRSRGGLYPKLRDMGFEDPESVFSRDTFEQDPGPFFSVASMILPPTNGKFTPAHAFLRMLQEKSKLLTLYTQNIDGIDRIAGIRRDKLVQLHGSFETATCISCGHCVKGEEIFPEIRKGKVPNCAECAKERQVRIDQMIAIRAQNGRSVRRKIQRGGVDSTSEPAGIMRPDIVFMGEPPKPYLKRFKRDCAQVDLVIVMGTSLPVEPVNTMPSQIPPKVPQIYIGKNQIYHEKSRKIDFDIQLLGECDVVAEILAKGCGWDLRHDMLPKDTTIEIEPWCGLRHCHLILREKMPTNRKDEESELEG
jgi:NAD+-dependent protein deacetylase SIR2